MRAMLTTAHGGRETLQLRHDVAEPVLGSTDLLLAVGATSVNFHDIFTRRGMPGLTIPMPCIMGLDFAGEIVELGAGVSGWDIGERVLVEPVDRVGGRGLLGEMRPGGLAELCAVPVHEMLRLRHEGRCETMNFSGCEAWAFRSASRNRISSGDSSSERLLSRIVKCAGP